MVDLRTSLKDLTLEGVKERDVQIGVGAYGVVKEYVYQGLRLVVAMTSLRVARFWLSVSYL